jgi:hypothetical protein
MLTEAKEHVLGQDRQALLISPYKYGGMGSHNDHNGSVQHLSIEMINTDDNRNDERVRS